MTDDGGAITDVHEVRDFVCTACGCACDDLLLQVDSQRVLSFEPSCPLAESFLLADRVELAAVDLEDAIARAAALLRSAQAPLVMGLERATVDAQRAAVAIADPLGAVIDPTDARGRSQSHLAAQTVGVVTATLGEVAARGDLVVYWQCDPATTHPRHMERFASGAGRRTIVVDSWPSPSAALADEHVLIPVDGGFESLAVLRGLVRGIDFDAEVVESRTGNELDDWRRLAERLQSVRYAAICYGAEADAAAVTELVRDLHRRTRAVALPLGRAPNAVGASQVLLWQTGFPSAVSFACGYPRYLPREATAAQLLARREVDAALIVGADPLPHLPRGAADWLRSIPTIVLDDRESATMQAATVAIPVAAFGLSTAGDVYRSDGVALPLQAAVASLLPSSAKVLEKLADAIT
jgi:formylmethanofuran dehydrogenase subunit B